MSSNTVKKIVFFVVATVALSLFVGQHRTYALTAAQLNARFPNAKATMVQADTDCTSRLNNAPGTGRTKVNNSNPYELFTWISASGSPTATTVNVPYGATSINLQLNQMQFICDIINYSNFGSDSSATAAYLLARVRSTNYPNDRSPNPDDGSNPINAASLFEVNTRINAGSATTGTISNISLPDYLQIDRSGSSRYWFASPVGFRYTETGGFKSSHTVTIRFNLTAISTFHNYPPSGVTMCTNPNPPPLVISTTPTGFSRCDSYTISLSFYVNVNKPPVGGVVGGAGAGCSQITGYVYDPNNSATKLNYYWYVNPPAGTPATYSSASRPPLPAILSGFRGPVTANLANPAGTPSTVPAGHGFAFTPPGSGAYNYNGDWSSNTYWLYALDPNTGQVIRFDTITQPPCGAIACSSSSFSGDFIVGIPTSFRVSDTITKAGVAPPGTAPYDTFTINIYNATAAGAPVGGPIQTYSGVPGSPSTGPPSGWVVTSDSRTFTAPTVGYYVAMWTYHGVTCSSSKANGAYAPYFSVLGGDITAGPGFGVGCTPNNTAGITGTNIDATGTGPFFGAGTQLAAMALGNVRSFASSLNANGSDAGAGPPSSLTFANTSPPKNLASQTYGGGFGLNGWCVPDYAQTAAGALAATPSPGSINVSSLPNKTTYYNGNLTITGGQIAVGTHALLVVTGNVYISAPITYAPYSLNGSDSDKMPQFQLLVRGGNIYVNNAVGALHGLYVTETIGAVGGQLYTCSVGLGVPVMDYNTCNHQLFVYGAVSASKLVLGRTWGNLRNAPGVTNTPAEQFIFTPETWLGNLERLTNGSGEVQAITSLPPVL